MNVSDLLVGRLRRWGVERVYAHAVRATTAMTAAASRGCGPMRLIAGPSAEVAALSAFAYAQFTGQPGVCIAAWGRETARALEALQDASMEGQPVVVLAGEGSPPRWKRHGKGAICGGAIAGGVTRVMEAAQAVDVLDQAIRGAQATRGVACVIVPRAIQEATLEGSTAAGEKGEEVAHQEAIGAASLTARGASPRESRVLSGALERLPAGVLIACEGEDLPRGSSVAARSRAEAGVLCPGMPYALSAKFAYPDRAVVAVASVRAMQMLGNNGLVAVSRYWRHWSDPRLVVLVVEDPPAAGGTARGATGREFGFSYSGYAEILGLGGVRAEDPRQLGSAIERALRAGRPVVIEVPAAGAGSLIEAAGGAGARESERQSAAMEELAAAAAPAEVR